MSSEWLAAESFERSHEVISAINTLSIHAKLARDDVNDFTSPEELQTARECLRSFLGQFENVVEEVERDEDAPVLGGDPRLGSLARQFVTEHKAGVSPSALRTDSLHQLLSLLDAKGPEEREQLILLLSDLRVLMQQHSHADVVGILGEI